MITPDSLAAVTGLRLGVVLALRWRHIDIERQAITVSEEWKGDHEGLHSGLAGLDLFQNGFFWTGSCKIELSLT